MKRFLSVLLCVLLLAVGVFAEEAESTQDVGRVEIEFCVGDATLLINGEEVTVEKPYVVGEGVTLVPVRVITEAFGATVGWVKETKTITLEYPDVNIVLQIGNPTAEINGRAETLLAAPELSAGGFTMVPLRFISENFGAEVGYDSETKRITVVKEAAVEGTTVEGAIENAYVGDSYFGWTMENPKSLSMSERTFDGRYVKFTYDASNYFYIYVAIPAEDYDFEHDFVTAKSSIANTGMSLVKADKSTDGDIKIMHLQAKDKTKFLNDICILADGRLYILYGSFDVKNNEIKDECVRVMSSFAFGAEREDVYDFSNVVDGYRKFESEELSISFDVPETFYLVDSESTNRIDFRVFDGDDNITDITAVVYSKSDVEGAQALAKYDYNLNKTGLNGGMTKFPDRISERTYGELVCYEYRYSIKSPVRNSNQADIFFEVGEYVYNISFTFDTKIEDWEEKVNKVMCSVVAQELDPDEIGILMRNLPDATGTYSVKVGKKATIELPNNYSQISETMYYSEYNGIIISFTVYTDDTYKYSDLKTIMKMAEDGIENEEREVISSTREIKAGNNKFQKYVVKAENEEEIGYIEQFMTANNGDAYAIMVYYPGLNYSQKAKEDVVEILSSLSFK